MDAKNISAGQISTLTGVSDGNPLEHTATYTISGKIFIVEPVFQKDGKETIGTILMKLMQSESHNKI